MNDTNNVIDNTKSPSSTVRPRIRLKTELSNITKAPDVTLYDCPKLFLNHTLEYKQKVNPKFSTRAWAKKMGFKGHSLLCFLLTGKRPILPSHLVYLLRGLSFSESERNYFEALVRYKSSKTLWEQELYLSKISEWSPEREHLFLNVEQARTIADWIHFAILEMTELKDFQNDPQWIANRLEEKVNTKVVETTINRLLKIGLLKIQDGKLVKTNQTLTIGGETASAAIREHHKQMIKLAVDAIDNQTMDERILNSFTLTINSNQVKIAAKLISDFRTKMEEILEKKNGNSTYQCNIQFFSLTKTKKEKIK